MWWALVAFCGQVLSFASWCSWDTSCNMAFQQLGVLFWRYFSSGFLYLRSPLSKATPRFQKKGFGGSLSLVFSDPFCLRVYRGIPFCAATKSRNVFVEV